MTSNTKKQSLPNGQSAGQVTPIKSSSFPDPESFMTGQREQLSKETEAIITRFVEQAINDLYEPDEKMANLSRERVYNVMFDTVCQVLSRCITETGFVSDGYRICYGTYTPVWANLVAAMFKVDADAIQDDLQRAIFDLWRSGARAAVVSSFAQSWLGEAQLTNLHEDIAEYFSSGGD